MSKSLFVLTVLLQFFMPGNAAMFSGTETRKISIVWTGQKPSGTIEITNGSLKEIRIQEGKGKIRDKQFTFSTTGENRLEIEILNAVLKYGSGATVVKVNSEKSAFSFFLRDINSEFPVLIPNYKVAVTDSDDRRTFSQIKDENNSKNLSTSLQLIENEQEESFENASAFTRNMECPTWLGISRDMRIFEIAAPQDLELIVPMNASSPVNLKEENFSNIKYGFLTGRGVSVEDNIQRKLEDGVLPILNTVKKDRGIEYRTTTFVTLESRQLNEAQSYGTHYLIADSSSYGHMFTPQQKKELIRAAGNSTSKQEETVLFFRAVATNTSGSPEYAWFRTVRPGGGWWQKMSYSYDKTRGYSVYPTGRVFGISKLNGNPLPDEEIAILLKPGETAVFEFFLPHEPISESRAAELNKQSFDTRLDDCRKFWRLKLSKASSIHLPEKRIEEMINAGLLHLDLITYGFEPDSTLAPSVGVYSPIGTESSPIIQFYASMGLSDQARRSLDYFLDKQHEDGMIQNFGGYMVETGAALWSMGEYFRYTNDKEWISRNKDRIEKAADFLIAWRERNKIESLRGKGYGMIDGKVADPEDPYHQYMLNGYAYIGVSRCSEMLKDIDPARAEYYLKESESWKKDIRDSFFMSMANSPVVPLGDGTWSPTVPPWTEAEALRLLYQKPETFLSHGTFTVSDAMLGPLYLVFCEVIDPEEEAGKMLLDYHSDMFYQRNAAFSQPYYSRHNWVQIKRGMVKPFLKTYYNTFSALADRETYTFWEHLYKVSVHKTHEEAWFLMETRWMLYLEDGKDLKLLPGIPGKWLEGRNTIDIKNVASYFGPVSFSVNADSEKGIIEAEVSCRQERKPARVIFRIPHPEGKIPVSVSGGEYDKSTESVIISNFSGSARILLKY